MKATAMTTQWCLIAVLAGMSLVANPWKAAADEYWTFVKVDCNPQADTFEIKEVGISNEEGEAQYKERSRIKDSTDKNGIYSLGDLLVESGTKDDPAVVPGKTLTKTCKLSTGTYVADISASKGISARGMCGAAEPSIELNMSTKGGYPFLIGLVFDNSCFSHDLKVIRSILIKGVKKEFVVSASWMGEPIRKKVFSTNPKTPITREEIFPDPKEFPFTITEAHQIALTRYGLNKKNVLYPIMLLEYAGIKEAVQRRPSEIKESTYVGLLNDYGFFLSETPNKFREAIPVLDKVISLSPKRHVAYLNLGDSYAKVLKDTTDSTKQAELRQLVLKNYQEYARLLKEKGIAGEPPPRVRDVLEAEKSK